MSILSANNEFVSLNKVFLLPILSIQIKCNLTVFFCPCLYSGLSCICRIPYGSSAPHIMFLECIVQYEICSKMKEQRSFFYYSRFILVKK